jgi:diaminopimelate epimerase
VVFSPNASEATARKFGPLIENNSRFPNRTNVQFLQVIDRQTLCIQIWERGAGYTLSSGSSSCAAAAAAYRFGLCENNITVHNPGGDLKVSITSDYSLRLTGPAARVFEGYLENI